MVAGGYDGERIGCASRQSDCDIKATRCRFPIQFQSSCLATWPESITLSLPAYGRSSFTGLSPRSTGLFFPNCSADCQIHQALPVLVIIRLPPPKRSKLASLSEIEPPDGE